MCENLIRRRERVTFGVIGNLWTKANTVKEKEVLVRLEDTNGFSFLQADSRGMPFMQTRQSCAPPREFIFDQETIPVNHPMHLQVALMVAAIAGSAAHAGSGNSVFKAMGLSREIEAGWTSPGDADEPPALIATGDFNRDGIADMVEVTLPDGKNSSQHFLTILLGQADGTFRSLASQSLIGRDPRALVVGDFNKDGNPDVILGDGDGTLVEFLGDGKGGVTRAETIATVGSVVSIAVGQFTHDGNLDLAVSDVHSNSAAILLGGGDGSFRLVWSFSLPKQGAEFRLATADFNRDGVADLVIMNEDSEDYEVMLGNGNGTFTYSPELSHLKDPNSYCPS